MLLLCLLMSIILPAPTIVIAQTSGLVYTVQLGDTLSGIAGSFRTTTTRMLLLNNLEDANNLYAGKKLSIPGFEDVQGEVIRTTVPYGISLSSYNKQLRIPVELTNRLNFITNMDEFYAGEPYYKFYTDEIPQRRVPISIGWNDLELAVRQNVGPWVGAEFNSLRGPWELIPNDSLFFPEVTTPSNLQSESTAASLSVSPSPMILGKTIEFTSPAPAGGSISGSVGTTPLNFFIVEENKAIALQGIPRLSKTGMTPLVLTITNPDGSIFSFQQNLLIRDMDYGIDVPLQVADSFVDPAVTVPELDQVTAIVQQPIVNKMWDSAFQSPSPTPDCLTSTFGRLRSFNGSPYEYYHSGLDFCGNTTTPIYAAAAGTVVFTGDLTVRGKATIISHGWGVYTGYWHQSTINVTVGDQVKAGETIGLVGATGRVTGPHLHFEIFVGGVQVDPTDWLQGKY